jgi:hypothetical protein
VNERKPLPQARELAAAASLGIALPQVPHGERHGELDGCLGGLQVRVALAGGSLRNTAELDV